jgi:hypothetical protein
MEQIKWTQFWDMHSGGGQKESFAKCYIEAPEDEAKIIFYNRFGHSPSRVSCTCCGPDYSISESETLAQATAYHRNCAHGYWDKDGREVPQEEAWVSGKGLNKGYGSGYLERPDTRYGEKNLIQLDEYVKLPEVMVIYNKDIKPDERIGEVPEQGYVWQD